MLAKLYRKHLRASPEFNDSGGSITLATAVPAERLMLVNYSQFPIRPDEAGSGKKKRVYSAISSHYKPITYRWEKLFPPEGSTAFEPKLPNDYVEETQIKSGDIVGTGGTRSNPQMGF